MADELLLRALREGLYLMLLVSAPVVLATLVAGLLTSALQAATQLQGPSLQALPRLIVAAVALALLAPWMGAQLLRFTEALFQMLPLVAGG